MLYHFNARVITFLLNLNLNLNFKILKQYLHLLQAMCIFYPTIYGVAMLSLVSYMKILIE
jgi:hypothetical protein